MNQIMRIEGMNKMKKMIKKTKKGYEVRSGKATGEKKLGGPYKTREAALKRLRQVEYFKRAKPGAKGKR